jgi:hypothetical protein
MMAMDAEPMIRDALRPVRAASHAPKAIPIAASVFGGTVILYDRMKFSEDITGAIVHQGKTYSCAFQVANPRLAMIVGCSSSVSASASSSTQRYVINLHLTENRLSV